MLKLHLQLIKSAMTEITSDIVACDDNSSVVVPAGLKPFGVISASAGQVLVSEETGFVFVSKLMKAYNRDMQAVKRSKQFNEFYLAISEFRSSNGLSPPLYRLWKGVPRHLVGDYACRELAIKMVSLVDPALEFRMINAVSSGCVYTQTKPQPPSAVISVPLALESAEDKAAKEVKRRRLAELVASAKKAIKEKELLQEKFEATVEELNDSLLAAKEDADNERFTRERACERLDQLEEAFEDAQTTLTTRDAERSQWHDCLAKAAKEVADAKMVSDELFKEREALAKDKAALEAKCATLEKQTANEQEEVDVFLSKWKKVSKDEADIVSSSSAPPEFKKRLVSVMYERILLNIEEDTKRRRLSSSAAAAVAVTSSDNPQ